jgi:L-fuconolactonase
MLNLPVIDAHHHLGSLRPGDAHGPDELWLELDAERITGTVLAVAEPSMRQTRVLLALAATVPWVQGVVGWVDLTEDHVGRAIAALRAGPGGELLVGIRHPADDEPEPAWLARDDVRRGLAAVGAAGLTVDLGVRPRELPAALEVCTALPDVRFVLEHLAAPPIASGDLSAWGRALLELAERPNVCATLSGLVAEADHHTWSIDDLRHPVELAVDAFGPERLMLGSDWPDCLDAGTYSDVMGAVRYLLAELPEHQQCEIRGTTAVRVYRLATRQHRARRSQDPAADRAQAVR